MIPWLCIKRIGDDLILVDGPLAEWRTPRKKRQLLLKAKKVQNMQGKP